MNRRHITNLALLCALSAGLSWWFSARMRSRTAASDEPDVAELALARGPVHTAARRIVKALTISGRVRDEQGRGIAVASVCAQRVDRGEWSAARKPSCTTAAQDGSFRLQPEIEGWLQISASAPEYEPATHPEPVRADTADGQAGVDLVLRSRGSRLAGHVLDALGGPVAGALVRVERELDGALASMTEADATGGFVLWSRDQTRVRMVATAEGYAAAQATWVAPAEGIQLVLSPASSLSGRVVLANDGGPVAGVTVRAHALDATTLLEDAFGVSGSDGTFTLTGVFPGTQDLTVASDRYRSRAGTAVDVGIAQHVRDLLVVVDRSVTVRGRAVIAGSAMPCQPGAFLLFDTPGVASAAPIRLPREGTQLDLDGNFELEGVLPGRYVAEVDCKNRIPVDRPRELIIAQDPVDGLQFNFAPGKRIRVRATDARGAPLVNAWVTLSRVPSDRSRKSGWAGFTSSEGWYEFGGLDEGTYAAAAVQHPDAEPKTVVLTGSDAEETVTLMSAGDAFIAVQIRGAPGTIDNRIEVHALPQQAEGAPRAYRQPYMAEPLGGGRFKIGPIAAGTYDVFVNDPINPSQTVAGPDGPSIHVAAGQTVALDFELKGRTGVIRGQVVDAAGAKVPDVWVSARYTGRRPVPIMPDTRVVHGESRVLTDDAGRFEIDGVDAEAVFTVAAERPDGGGRTQREGVRVGDEVVLELQAPGLLEGRVIDDHGRPVDSFQVQARSDPSGAHRAMTVEDPEGRFSLRSVAAGQIDLVAQTRSGSVGALQISLAPSQELHDLRIVTSVMGNSR